MSEAFLENLEAHFEENLEGVSPLQKVIREKAWERFLELGLPRKQLAGYEYFPLSHFYQESYELATVPDDLHEEQIAPLVYPDCRQSHIVFVNGQYAPELSDTAALPKEVVILRLRDALNTYGNFLQGRLSRALKEETDPLATLNIALIQMGLFLYVPPKVVIDRPIQCLNLISNDRSVIFNPRIHFFLGKEASCEWIYDHHCIKDFEYFSNGVVDIALEEGARFTQYGALDACKHGWSFEAIRATLKRDSHFKSITCTSGTKSVRQDFRISLLGENASCDLKGLSILSDNRQAHTNVLIEHAAPHCVSNQLFKNVLKDSSRASFEGKIYVHPKAQKTEAYQLNNSLLLGERAMANSKPNLEIFADDVKASHGATVTQLSEEHLHYLRTRGVGKEVAHQLLQKSFYLELLDEVTHPLARDRMSYVASKSAQ